MTDTRQYPNDKPKNTPEITLEDGPDFLIEVLSLLKKERELAAARQRQYEQLILLNRRQHEKIIELEPKADYYDALVNSTSLTSFRETAKLLGVRERDFTRWLETHRYCFRTAHGKLLPYADKLFQGLFSVKEVVYAHGPDGETRTTAYAKITPKGRAELFRKMRATREGKE